VALTIAGSDSGGGAGIQADLKTFQALGVYGTSVITAVTAQNTLGVRAVHEIPAEVVAAQIDAVVEDLGVDGAKTGMLASADLIATVADRVRHWRLSEVLVVDPVMVAKSGDRLLRADAVDALIGDLLPLAAVLTPNLPEAEVLAGFPVRVEADMKRAAQRLAALGAKAVLMKGGHLEGELIVDLLFHDGRFERFEDRRIPSRNTHGTGCTLASAIAAGLAQGLGVECAVDRARDYVQRAIAAAPGLGRGHGPLDHAHPLRADRE
jgi:hydroxymethylpyrimidine/phosphomethylpyrimidine kinase